MIENENLDDGINKNTIQNDKEKENQKQTENETNEINIEKKESEDKEDKNNDLIKEDELNNSFFDENKDIDDSEKIEFKVILVGDSGVGKTSILKRFISGEFTEKMHCTIDVDISTKFLKIDKNLYAMLKIHDTAGQEKYRAITKSFFRTAEGVILVFDLTDENSFNRINKWINDINENTENVEIVMVGNKADLNDRQVSKIKAENFAYDKNFKYIETSAKDGTNILLLFEELATGIYKRRKEDNSICDIKSVDTYIFRRTELNKLIKNKKEKKCCQF